MLVANMWQNTGMPNQPIWVYNAEREDVGLGERVGDYVALSADMSRMYRIMYDGIAVEYQGFMYYAEDEVHKEGGNTPEYACHHFIECCEKVFTDGYCTNVWFKDIAENMIAMSERLGLGWVMQEQYNREEYSEYWEVYSAEFAKKTHIKDQCIFCFSEESAEEAINDYVELGRIARSSMEFESVLLADPDGGYEEESAIVVYWAEQVTVRCFDNEDDEPIQAELVDTFDNIEGNYWVTMSDLSEEYEVLFTDKGTYARRKEA